MLGSKTYTDWSHLVYPSVHETRFTESEFAIAREMVPEARERLNRWFAQHPGTTSFPVEVRFAATDDVWLSTAYRRESAYIAVHQYAARDNAEYSDAFWTIMADCDGRPHWGKLRPLGSAELRGLYPRLDEFVAVRDQLDPARTFANPYLDRVLGA